MNDRILLFGNSAAGKSTLAQGLAERRGLAHLDLDTLAWLPVTPPQRCPIADSAADIDAFANTHDNWVIEGCYADLLALMTDRATEAIWLNLPVEICVEHARARPWEPHKYSSKEAQDANLEMLIGWIRDYDVRNDTFSRSAHRELFNSFPGPRRELIDSTEVDQLTRSA